MGRPSKLTPAQWLELERRLMEGETASALGRDFGISEAAIRKRFGSHESISAKSTKVRATAQMLADAQDALEELPAGQRPIALDLATTFRNITRSVAKAAEMGADTGRMLHEHANTAVKALKKGADVEQFRAVAAMTRTGNEALVPALALLNANKDRARDEPPPVEPVDRDEYVEAARRIAQEV